MGLMLADLMCSNGLARSILARTELVFELLLPWPCFPWVHFTSTCRVWKEFEWIHRVCHFTSTVMDAFYSWYTYILQSLLVSVGASSYWSLEAHHSYCTLPVREWPQNFEKVVDGPWLIPFQWLRKRCALSAVLGNKSGRLVCKSNPTFLYL